MRPIGKQIRAMLAASDQLGEPAPASAIAFHARIAHTPTNLTKLCRRAEAHGLMTVQEGAVLMFLVVPGWRVILGRLDNREPMQKPAVDPVRRALSQARAHGIYAGLM
jgi:hypothetical protein